ncbi:MAG TPA: sulfotransferase [Nevskiaceae bacterium]|nr:sulfotransferase [Nevskiaceae bacterium]
MFQGSTDVRVEGAYDLSAALEGARAEAGLRDFGDDAFLEPLEMLLRCVRADVPFSEMGLANFKATVQRFLVNRLRLQRDVAAHPEILDEDVSDPIVILGMPRTGTTKLQRLVSADPRMQKLALWRLLNPAPFDDEKPGSPAGRLAFARIVEAATRANPAFTAAHETAAEEADEDSFLALMSFDYVMLYCIFPSPSYLAWVRARPQREAHRFERRLLQYLQWQDGGKRGRRWVLKNPGAIGFLEPLHEVFPSATYVHAHRDMTEVIPSYCRLMEAIQQPLLRHLDPHTLGRDVLAYWVPEVARYHAARRGLGPRIDVLDVAYGDVVAEPIDLVRTIYERAGVPWTQDAIRAMQAWSDANRQYKHGRLDYSPERYGLTAQMIRDAFGGSTATSR